MTFQDIFAQIPSQLSALPDIVILLFIVWVVLWKGLALWKSARLNSPIWFVVLLVINTMGILEILYIFVFSKFGFDHLSSKKRAKKKK